MPNELVKQISYVLYKADEKDVKVNALLKDESIWLTQKSMAELFDCSADNIGLHLKNIFTSGELEKSSVTEESSATASDGKNYKMTFYNLDAIISVGYRVNSAKATKFRIWATNVLKEYIKKGFVMDDEREIPFNMEQFAARVNEFLEFRKYDILEGNGRISRNDADTKAFAEYDIFNRTQKIDSDFGGI